MENTKAHHLSLRSASLCRSIIQSLCINPKFLNADIMRTTLGKQIQ